MRLRRLVPCAVPCAVLAACLTGCGGVDGGVRVEGPAATTIPWTGPVYMTDWYGRAWQRPVEVEATMRLSLSRLSWREWGSSRARATGVVTDVTCLSGCPDGNDNPPSFRVHIVLNDPVRRGDVSFYSHASLTPVHPPMPFWARGSDDTSLDVPDA